MKRGRPPRDLSMGRLTCVTCRAFKPLKGAIRRAIKAP
jgi:hypothetical protein